LEEKRNFPRFALGIEVRIAALSPIDLPEQPRSWLRGITENVSSGGVAFFSDRSFPSNSLVCCEVAIPGTRVVIPTLLKVRWAAEVEAKTRYKLGLEFLLRFSSAPAIT
jgi:hypothetical protein